MSPNDPDPIFLPSLKFKLKPKHNPTIITVTGTYCRHEALVHCSLSPNYSLYFHWVQYRQENRTNRRLNMNIRFYFQELNRIDHFFVWHLLAFSNLTSNITGKARLIISPWHSVGGSVSIFILCFLIKLFWTEDTLTQ